MLSQLRQFSLVLIFFIALIPTQSLGQCGAVVDLNTWSQLGPVGNGTWTVNAAGTQVVQSINGFPTFFVSPQNFINVVIKGTITTTSTDDDFIGFVFGLQSPASGTTSNAFNMESYLFDWSRVPHSSPNPGRYLIEIDGPVDITGNWNPWWYKTADPSFNYLAQTTGVGTGWVPNVIYDFTLTYLSNRVIIEVNGVTFFDIVGCFPPGKFGFYNFSQSPVTYSNFAYELLPDFSIGANNVCQNDSASFVYLDNSCTGPLFTTAFAGVQWDFGDGNTSTVLNPKHLYAFPGSYIVKLIVTDNLGCTDSTTRVINIIPIPAQPSILSSGGNLCVGQTLNLAGNGGGGVSYSWSGPNGFVSNLQNPSLGNLSTAASGTYTLVTSNGTCSSLPASTNITVNPTPATPILSSNGPICAGGSLNLTSNSQIGASYSWTGPAGFSSNSQNPVVSNVQSNASGAYQVTTTVNGCPSAVGQTNVVVNPIPGVNVFGNTNICFGSSTTLTASGANTYAWNNGNNNAANSVSPSTTTTYNVTGTSTAGCVSAPVPITVTVNPIPVVNLGPDTVVCDVYTLDAGTGGTNGYSWNNGAMSQTIQVTTSGAYSVMVTNNGNCTASDVVNVTIDVTPNVMVSGNTSICEGQSTTLVASGGNSYVWSNGPTTSSNPVIPGIGNTTYTVVGTSPLGCVGPPQPITVTVDPNPVVNLGADTTVCDSFILDAGPGGTQSYLWSNGATTRNLTVTNSGLYSVTVANSQGCASVESINVTVNNTQGANLGLDQNVCPDQPVVLNPGSFTSYAWSNGATTPTLSAQASGIYTVDVIDINGCPSTDSVAINIYPLLTGNVGADTLICDGTTLPMNAGVWGGASYTWSPNGETTAQISPGIAGLYTVAIDDGNGCIYMDSLDLTVDIPPALSLAISDSIQCDGAPVTFIVSPGSLSNYNFAINGGSIQSGSGTAWMTTLLQSGDVISVTGTTVAGCDLTYNSPVNFTILPSPSGTVMVDTVCDGTPTSLLLNPVGGNTISWTGSGGLTGNTPTLSFQYPGPGTFPYTVTIGNGTCDTVITSAVEVRAIPAAPAVQEVVACEGDDITLTLPGGGNIEWYDAPIGGGLLNIGNDFALGVVNPLSSDSFYVQQTSLGCASARNLSSLLVYQRPSASFMTEPDTNIILNIPRSDVRFMNLSSSATSYTWDFGDGFTSTADSPLHNYNQPGIYYVTLIATVGSGSGCQDSVVYGPYEVVDLDEFTAPNAFTPNGDGNNDTWVIDDLYFFPDNKMTIFNRWGDTVFETERYQNDWDGSWKGKPLPEGTYYYVVDLGEGFRLVKGFVTVYR